VHAITHAIRVAQPTHDLSAAIDLDDVAAVNALLDAVSQLRTRTGGTMRVRGRRTRRGAMPAERRRCGATGAVTRWAILDRAVGRREYP